MLTKTLQSVPIFASLPGDALLKLENSLEKIELSKGQVLFYEGDAGDSLYIILAGEMEIIKFYGSPESQVITVRKSGEFIGEIALLIRDGIRTATVTSKAQSLLLRISHADFDLLMHQWPEIAFEMLREISFRFWERDKATIRDLQEKNSQLHEAYEELRIAQEQIIAKEMLERELQMARKIQESILPNRLPSLDGFQFGAFIEPAKAVGGDFYDVFLLEKDRIGLVIGDVSDKGMPAAIFMALVRSLVRAKASPVTTPRQVLERVNRLVLLMNNEGMFATVIFGILDRSTRDLTYARAGHESPLLFSNEGEFIQVPFQPGQPLGLFPDILLDEQTIHLPPGGQLLFYTDGVTDASSADGEQFELPRLIKTVQKNIGSPAQILCDKIWDSVKQHQGNSPQSDDVTLVVVSANLTA